MADRDDIRDTVDRYVRHLDAHDVEALTGLFAPDAVQHEPLGVDTYRGIDAIRSFDERNARIDFSVTRHAEITVSGRYAATQLRVSVPGLPDFLTTDLFEFDDDGRIVALSVLLDPDARP